MKKLKIAGIVFFWLTLLSPMVAFMVACPIGEVDIFEIAGMIRYAWVMWFFALIGIVSIIIGVKLKQGGQRYKKNFIASFICVPLILIFGSYGFIFGGMVSFDTEKINSIEQTTKLELPNDIKMSTEISDGYTVSYVKILDRNEKEDFEREIASSKVWTNKMSTKIAGLLPFSYNVKMRVYDYFMFYNVTKNEYNVYPPDGEYKCVLIAYNCSLNKMIILDNFTVVLN